MRANIYVLIGPADAGKSTTVAYLTGRTGGRPASRSILQKDGGYLSVWSKTMAWQEDNKSPFDAIDELKKFAARSTSRKPKISTGSINALMTLRFDAFRNPGIANSVLQPPAEEYLSAFVNEDWNISSLVLFCDERDQTRRHFERFGAPTLYYPNATSRPHEAMAGGVRRHFNWA